MITTLENIQVENVLCYIESDVQTKFLMGRLKNYHPDTYWHCIRVAYLAVVLARAYRIPETEQEVLFRSALLHDIGKLLVPLDVLDKEEKLSVEEWALIQTHPRKGAELVKLMGKHDGVNLDVLLYHHENIDGSGYPFCRGKKELKLPVRIVRVVDSFDAMTSKRSYRPSMCAADALKELYASSGTCFDFDVVCKFERLIQGNLSMLESIIRRFSGRTRGTQGS